MQINDVKWVGHPAQIVLAKERMIEKKSYKEFMEGYPYRMAANPQLRRVKDEIWQYYADNYPDSIQKDNEGGKWTLAEVDAELAAPIRARYNIQQGAPGAQPGAPGAQPGAPGAPVPGGGKGKSRRNGKSKKSKKSKKGKQSRKARKTRIKSNRRRGPR